MSETAQPAHLRTPIIAVVGHVDSGKCVAKGTKVFLADGQTVPIEQLYDSAEKSGKIHIQNDGLCVELEKPIFVLGGEGKVIKPLPVSHMWKLEKKNLIRITCDNGFTVETTPEHPFPVLNDNFGISFTPVQDLSENTHILVPGKLPIVENDINLLKSVIVERLSEQNFIAYLGEEFCHYIEARIADGTKSVYRHSIKHARFRLPQLLLLNGGKMPLNEVYDKIEFVKYSTTVWRAGHGSKKIRLPKTEKDFEDFFYFIGLFFGDGENRNAKLTNNDTQLLEFYRDFSERVFHIPSVIRKGHTCLESVPIGGKALPKFIQCIFDIPPGKKSHTIHSSKIIQLASNKLVANFIRGYFDTDGYVNTNRNVELTSVSKKMIEGLSYLLLRFGIRSYIYPNKTAYRLTISGAENIFRFKEFIGFGLEHKKKSFENYCKVAGTSRKTSLTPISGQQTKTLRLAFGIGNKRIKIPFLEKTETYKNISFPFLVQFASRLKEKAEMIGTKDPNSRIKLENLYALSTGDLRFAKIIKKEEIPNEHGFVYDITQPKTHTFVANGLLLHNTSFLDAVRSTKLAAKEPGYITQHIGATEIPIEIVQKIAGDLLQKFGFKLTIPGLLFIDTPGHEAFTNLRERGSSIADLAVLMVDITKGLQAQTKEAITILRSYKVPFVVCLNKIDLIEGYESTSGSFLANLKNQDEATKKRVDEKLYTIVGQLFEAGGFQSERFDRVQDTTKELALIPICSQTGEGLPETLVFLSGLAQKFLEQNLKTKDDAPGKGTLLEVRDEKGLGTTIDVILYDGVLRVGDPFVVAGKNGVIQTKVRALMRPNTATDIRMAEKWVQVKEIHAAAGIKISAPGLENAIAGSPFLVASESGEESKKIESEVSRIKIDSDAIGTIVKTDTLGSLEALAKLLQSHQIPVKRADVGEVTHRDIMEASALRAKDPYAGVIFAFNVSIPEAVRKDAHLASVKLIESNIVYSLSQEYTKWIAEEKAANQKALLEKAILPCELALLPGFVFRNSKPAVVGVRIKEGRLKVGAEVMNKKGEIIGRVQNIQVDSDAISIAHRDQEVAVSIDGGVIGRNLFEKDILLTKITPGMQELLKKIDLNEEEKILLAKIIALQLSLNESDNEIKK